MKPRILALGLVILAGVLGPAGCASQSPDIDAATVDALPTDFTFAVTVLAPAPRRNTAAIPRESRPMRFVMETDRILRTYTGAQAAPNTFPPETRQLTDEEVLGIWGDMRAAGLLSLENEAIIGTPPSVTEITEPVWVVVYMAHGVNRMLLLKGAQRDPVRPLLDRLADLAWMPE